MTVDERSEAQIHLDDLQKALKEGKNLFRQLTPYIASYGHDLAEKVNHQLNTSFGVSETLKRDISELEHELHVAEESLAAVS